MTVYAEYLFFENFIIGYLILFLTGKACATRSNQMRLLIGSIMCAFFSFQIFIEICTFGKVAVRLIFSISVIRIVFGKTNIKILVMRIFSFYCVTFMLGGCCIAIMYLTKSIGFTTNKIFYTELTGVPGVASGIITGAIAIYSIVGYLRSVVGREDEKVNINLIMEGKEIKLCGMVDTGNFLLEPLSGKPVNIISRSVIETAFPTGIPDERMRIIPYERVGEHKLMKAYRFDSIFVGNNHYADGYIALYDGSFGSGANGEEYDILLQRNFFRGRKENHG